MKMLTALTLISGALVLAASAQDSGSELKMGLAERRAVKDFQDNHLPELRKKINEAAGFDVPLEIDWNSIAKAGEAEHYTKDEYWKQIYFQPLAAALKGITQDDLGKEALKNGLKKVAITYKKDSAPASNYSTGLTFEGGTLTINFTPWSNAGDEQSSDFKERVKAIRGALEPKL